MPEQQQQQTQDKESDTDERGVPWSNRLKELERKYEKELSDTRRELTELKASFQQDDEQQVQQEDMSKVELMEFVKNPKGYIENAYRQAEFQREIPQAEAWIKNQPGFSASDEERISQIIKENRLDTPYHTPMQRARTAWSLLNAEKRDKQTSDRVDEEKRETSVQRTTGEGTGKATSKQAPVTRNDLLRKLAQAEASGDIDASIKLISALEDVR